MASYNFNITIPLDYVYERKKEEDLSHTFMDEVAELIEKHFGKRCEECSISMLYEEDKNVRFN